MTRDELALIYDSLTRDDQARFLAYLVHQLTIDVRGFYSDDCQVVNSKLGLGVGAINEIQHRVAGCLILVLDDKPDRPTGKSIISEVLDRAKYAQVEQCAQESVERALSSTRNGRL